MKRKSTTGRKVFLFLYWMIGVVVTAYVVYSAYSPLPRDLQWTLWDLNLMVALPLLLLFPLLTPPFVIVLISIAFTVRKNKRVEEEMRLKAKEQAKSFALFQAKQAEQARIEKVRIEEEAQRKAEVEYSTNIEKLQDLIKARVEEKRVEEEARLERERAEEEARLGRERTEEEMRRKHIEELRSLIYENIESLIYNYFYYRFQYRFSIESKTLETVLLKLNAGVESTALNTELGHAEEIWRLLQSCKFAEQICNHSDLMKMNDNLKRSSVDNDYRHQKLFKMYEKFYSEEIPGISDWYEFSRAMTCMDNSEIFASNRAYYLEHLEPAIPDMLLQQYSKTEIIQCLNDPQLRNMAKDRAFAGTINRSLHLAMARIISENYGLDEMLQLMLDCSDTIIELNTLQGKYEDEQERQRLLGGDMSYEKSLMGLKLRLENVKTGADFEGYLQYIFSRLGYGVLQTKGSGDMGADLVLTKNDVKCVIQAKYYSSSVGFDAVKEIHTAKDIYKANKAAVVTNNTFTKQAVETARRLNIVLIDGSKLQRLVNAVAQGEFIDVF